mgnify:CR=1 FL=1
MKSSLPRHLLLLFMVVLITGVSYGQRDRVAKAALKEDRYSYIDAREIYLKVVESGYTSAQLYSNLGDTYYYNSDYPEAANWYQKLIDEFPEEVETEYYYKAAVSVRSLGQDDKAKGYMQQYVDNGGNALIVKKFTQDPEYLTRIAENPFELDMDKSGINTDGSDYVSSFYGKDMLVFASTTNSTGDKVFDWTNEGFLDLFFATIGPDGELTGAYPVPGDVNTAYHESSTTFSKDGNTMYFTRNNFNNDKKRRGKDKTLGLKIYKATKGADESWGNVEEVPFNSDDYNTAHPTITPDGKYMIFASDMPLAGEQIDKKDKKRRESDLWYVTLDENGVMGDPVNMGTIINTEGKETFPYVSPQNILYFSSNGHMGLGGLDVFSVDLNGKDVSGDFRNLGEPTNSAFDDFAFVYDEERKLGFVSSNRDGGKGSVDDDIYRLKRCIVTIAGTVINRDTGEVLPGSRVTLLDENNTEVATTIAGPDGRYTFEEQLHCGTIFIVRAKSEGCESNEKIVETPTSSQVMEVPMPLTCDPCPPDDLGCRLSLQPIYFDFDRYNIREDAAIELAKILAAMQEYPQLVIHIESHTDSRGNDAYNEQLSEKRAQSTLNWLVDQGIDRERLSAKGYGEYQLQNRCSNGVECTEEEHQLNRRSMFIIQN